MKRSRKKPWALAQWNAHVGKLFILDTFATEKAAVGSLRRAAMRGVPHLEIVDLQGGKVSQICSRFKQHVDAVRENG